MQEEEDLFGDLEVLTTGKVSVAETPASDLKLIDVDEFIEEDEFEGLEGNYSRVSIQKEAYEYKSQPS